MDREYYIRKFLGRIMKILMKKTQISNESSIILNEQIEDKNVKVVIEIKNI